MIDTHYIERMRSISLRLAPECARIERESSGSAWSMEELVEYLRTGAAFGKAVMDSDEKTVLGYMAYRIVSDVVDVGRIIVHPDSRRKGVATAMLARLKEKVGHNGINRVWIEVPEPDVAMYCCLKLSGFSAAPYSDGPALFYYEV